MLTTPYHMRCCVHIPSDDNHSSSTISRSLHSAAAAAVEKNLKYTRCNNNIHNMGALKNIEKIELMFIKINNNIIIIINYDIV